MQEYDLKRGFQDNVQPDKLRALIQEIFGNVEEKDGKFVSSFGALREFRAWTGKKSLFVETVMDPSVPNDVAQSTIKAYNSFLERATGMTSKERSKRVQKKAKVGKL